MVNPEQVNHRRMKIRRFTVSIMAFIVAISVITFTPFTTLGASGSSYRNQQQIADVRECDNVPVPARGSTLRVVNFLGEEIYVGRPGYSLILQPGEVRDIPVVPGDLWTWAPNRANVVRTRIDFGTSPTYCLVLGEKTEETAASSEPSQPVTTGEWVSLQSFNFPDHYIRHGGLNGYISAIPEEIDRKDATFRMGPGLADANHVSFESSNYPNYFLVVEGDVVVLRERPSSAEFDSNATFIKHPGLSDATLLSLESFAKPGHYVRHSSYQLYVHVPDGTDVFAADATFRVMPPQWTSSDEPTAQPTTELILVPTATSVPATESATESATEATATPTVAATAAPALPTPAPTATPTSVPTATPTPQLSACTQEDFLKAVKDGDASGTITLDGSCHYMLTTVGDNWNGGSAAFLFNATVVEGNGAVIERSASAPKFRIFAFQAASGVVVRDLTIRNGANTKPGGAIYSLTNLTLENVILESSTSDDVGGAVAASKDLVLSNVTIKNSSSKRGGAIFAWGKATLENVVLEGNTATDMGGAITSQGNLALTNVTIKDGVGSQGGAISQLSGDLTIHNSRLINNSAAQQGGAIYKQAGKLEITNSVFAQNRVADGNGATLFVGGGVDAASTLINNTITDNDGNLGSAITHWSSLTVRNTIIANHATAITSGGSKTVLTEDNNLFAGNTLDVQSINSATATRGGNSVKSADVQFVDAATLNYAIKSSSPAVDKGAASALNATNSLATDIATLPRPYSGTLVDIGAYELQGEGGPALSIAKQGPHWIVAGSAADYSITVANQGVRSADDLVVIDVLPVGANYVADSSTPSGNLSNGTLTWDIGSLAPGESVFIQYSVVASQTLVSLDHRVQSATDPAVVAQGKVITSPLNSKIIASTGFLPRPDGFSFYNYGNDGEAHNNDLTVDDMIFIFGEDIVCKSKNPCVLTSTAQAWRTKWLRNLEGGHCAGMAMGSLNIFANASVAPSDLDPAANFTFDLSKDSARRYVALYAATQGSTPVNSNDLKTKGYEWSPATVYTTTTRGGAWVTNPVDVLDVLIKNLSDPNATDRYRLSFRNYPPSPGVDGGAGHTVVPFAIEKLNDNDYLIYIYENNVPNTFDLAIKINRSTGNWSYVGTTSPDKPLNKYYGDKTSDNLTLTSWQWASSFPKNCEELCPKGSITTTTTTSSTGQAIVGTVAVQLDGEGFPLVTRSDGKRVGFDPNTGEWISEIEGAQSVDVLLGLGLNTPPAIQIPHEEGMTYGVEIASRETAFGNTEAVVNVNIAGPGFAVNVTDLVLNSPEAQPIAEADVDGEAEGEVTDEVTDEAEVAPVSAADLTSLNVDPDNNRIVFAPGTDDAEAPSISLAVSQPDGSDFSVDVIGVNVGQGNAVALGFNEDSQSITIESNSGEQADYQVEVNRINTDGTQDTFVSDALSNEGAAGVTLKVGDEWNGDDTPEIQLEDSNSLPELTIADLGDDTASSGVVEYTLCDASDVPAPTHGGVTVRFVNASGSVARLSWKDSNGNLVEYHVIDLDAFVDQETFATHEWIATDEGGNVLLDYVASEESTQCVVIES